VDEQLKKRLVGAAVLASLVVIFLPMVLDDEGIPGEGMTKDVVPERKIDREQFKSRVLPLPSETGRPIVVERPQPLAPIPIGPEEVASEAPQTPRESPQPAEQLPGPVEAVPPEQPKPMEAKVDASTAKPTPQLRSWAVQVASFPSREGALKLLMELRDLKFTAYVQEVNIKDKAWYRVRVGPEVDRQRVDLLLSQLQEGLKGRHLSPQVVRHP
jgi:DedD protein